MGYYTKHTLTISDGDTQEIEKFWDTLKDDLDIPNRIRYAVGDDGGSNDGCKWYEHKNDMCRMSKLFPSILFKLEGEGEDSGDIWIEYHKNGLMQRCDVIMTFEDFDESKMR